MYKDERDIYYYDAVSAVWNRKFPEGLKAFPHYELAEAIEAMFEAERAEFTQSGTKQSIYITDLSLFADRCEMLIGFTDPNAADPTLNNRPARKRRVVRKKLDEGLEHSAHIIWHYKTKTNNKPCPFYLEGAVGLRAASILRFVNRLLREYAKDSDDFELPDPEGTRDADGNFVGIKTRPRIDLTGHPSAEFIRDLKKGELTELELITEKGHNHPWDGNGYTLEDSRKVILKPNSAKLLPKAKSVLDGVFSNKVKNDYEYARIKFKTDADVLKTVDVYSKDYNLVNDHSYVKKDRIDDLGGNLPNAFPKIQAKIIKKMRDIAGI